MPFFVGRLHLGKKCPPPSAGDPLVLKENPQTKLVILGKDNEQAIITETVERLNIRDNVVYRFDFVPEKERILHHAALSDVCVFPSTYEPFGNVSLEAMSVEKPVVVGARGVVGFKEQVMNSETDQNGLQLTVETRLTLNLDK